MTDPFNVVREASPNFDLAMASHTLSQARAFDVVNKNDLRDRCMNDFLGHIDELTKLADDIRTARQPQVAA